jgi:hypothetical protein
MAYETKVLTGRDIPESHRKNLPPEDFAGKGMSFPIETPEDVHDAAQSIGRAGDDNYLASTLKANIKRIAKRKGAAFEARLPESWKDDDKAVVACEVVTERGPQLVVRLSDSAAGLVRIPLAKLGHWVKGKLKFNITRQTMAEIAKNFRKRPADTVIDYEHASEMPEVAQGGPVPAAGWIKAVDDAPGSDGVLYGQAEFTPRAQKMIADKEIRYISPVIDWGARDKHSGDAQGATLASAALTNRPFLDEMPALALSDREWHEIDRGDAANAAGREKRVVKVTLADRVACTVRVTDDNGTESTLKLDGLDPQPKVLRLSDVKRTKEGVYDFAALEVGEGILIAGDVFHGMLVQQELDADVKAGKITPAQRAAFERIALTDLSAYRDIVKTLPKQVETGELGTGTAEGAGNSELDRVQAQLLRLTDAKMKADPTLQYHQALKLVASENRALEERYAQLSRRASSGKED